MREGGEGFRCGHVVHLGDCIEGMRALPDKSVDVAIMDPPFSEHVHRNAKTNRQGSGGVNAIGFDPLTNDLREKVADELARVVRRWVLVFCESEGDHLWRGELIGAGLEYIRTGRWVRLGTMPQVTGDRPAQGDEAIVIAHPFGKKRWNGGGRPAVWSHAIANGDGRIHPTQKPESLMAALVADFTEPGELVLDCFVGSGTTGVACKRLGRRFVGWEKDPAYQRVAQARIDATHEQLELVRVKAPKVKQEALFGKAG